MVTVGKELLSYPMMEGLRARLILEGAHTRQSRTATTSLQPSCGQAPGPALQASRRVGGRQPYNLSPEPSLELKPGGMTAANYWQSEAWPSHTRVATMGQWGVPWRLVPWADTRGGGVWRLWRTYPHEAPRDTVI